QETPAGSAVGRNGYPCFYPSILVHPREKRKPDFAARPQQHTRKIKMPCREAHSGRKCASVIFA
ncbi:MAG: hypothetical protein ACLVGX_08565, partial [Oscillospiraceae bacterium]